MTTVSCRFKFRYTQGKPLSHQTLTISLNQHKTTLTLDHLGYSQPLSFTLPITFILDCFEMVDHQTGYPTHRQQWTFHQTSSVLPIIEVIVFPEPFVIDLQKNPLPSQALITYLKEHGRCATAFIHGFNIEQGTDGSYPLDYSLKPIPEILEPHLRDHREKQPHHQLIFTPSQYIRTIGCNFMLETEILSQFPSLGALYAQQAQYYHPERNPEGQGPWHLLFNGTGAKQWFTLMEYNLNRAAGLTDRFYENYTRLIRVTWPGDLHLTRFIKAKEIAYLYATRLFELIDALTQENIQLNLIGHSLGCVLIVEMLSQVVQWKHHLDLNKVFLWQAALASKQIQRPELYDSVSQLMVLHSRQDKVLQNFFYPRPVLGYHGIEHFTHPKLVQIDQSAYLGGHSHMKVPTAELFQAIYEGVLVDKTLGINGLGKPFNFLCVSHGLHTPL